MKYILIMLALVILSNFLLISDFFFNNKVFAQSSEKNKFLPTLLESNLTIQVVQIGLDFPTKMTFVDEETILVAEKVTGKIREIKNLILRENPILDLHVESGWEKGLVGLSSAKISEKEDYVFVYFTESTNSSDTRFDNYLTEGNENNGTKLVRYIWDGKMLRDPQLLLHPIHLAQRVHQGGAMTILNNHLYLLVGDNNQRENFLINHPASEKVYDQGIIFRIDMDGNAVPSNPFQEPNLSKYFAFGIRNGYGLAVDPNTQNIWDTENGPENFDEINMIFSGFNSGWKKIMGPNMNGSTNTDYLTRIEGSAYSDPEFSWKTPIGVTAIEFMDSKKYGSEFENSVLVGDVFGNIYRFELNDDRDGFVFSDPILDDKIEDSREESASLIFGKNFGIITDIKMGPDGFLYLVSMIQSDEKFEWGVWASYLSLQDIDLKNQGPMMGTIFRIVPSDLLEDTDSLSPRKQFSNGVLPRDITCKEDLKLIFKFTDNSPLCIKPSTLQKLQERGWKIR